MPTKVSAPLQLTGAFQIVHTVDSHRWLTIAVVHIVNTSNAAVNVRLCYAPPLVAPVASNAELWDFSLGANTFLELNENTILFPSWTIWAMAGTPSVVNVRVSGIEDIGV